MADVPGKRQEVLPAPRTHRIRCYRPRAQTGSEVIRRESDFSALPLCPCDDPPDSHRTNPTESLSYLEPLNSPF